MVKFVDLEKTVSGLSKNTNQITSEKDITDAVGDPRKKEDFNVLTNEQTIRVENDLKGKAVIIDNLPFQDDSTVCSNKRRVFSQIKSIKNSAFFQWLKKQYKDDKNRYSFQMATAFTIASLFAVITPLSNVFKSAFWMGVCVVTVLDNTMGGMFTLGMQRMLGTLIGGALSIIVMTIVRAMFEPYWDARSVVVLNIFMFIQVFVIAKIKLMPNYAFAGGIGLLTTVIILLSGYNDIIDSGLSYVTELGAWRVCNMLIGVLIAMFVSTCVFPTRSLEVMRANLGKSMEKAANLYQRSAEFYLDFNKDASSNISLASILERRMATREEHEPHQATIKETLQRIFSNTSTAEGLQGAEVQNEFWSQDEISNISNEAIGILFQLQTESTRLRNVSNEYKFRIFFHFLEGGKNHCKRYLRRTQRYCGAIEAMKRSVWPLASFRLLFPLIHSSVSDRNTSATRMTPTKETLECFADSLTVMRSLGAILKDNQRPLSDFKEDWVRIHRMVNAGIAHAQRELKETLRIGNEHTNMDGLKLISYYGFLVRCSMIWDGLKTVVDQLSPFNGALSRAPSVSEESNNTTLPDGEVIHPTE
ncbi:aluminum activated malate transporter-domain-containing protein [Sporodiniella umbellata]|nr:aluminum activated malate transporter-domain-containing protein [Sporodiniella umbellata]